MSSKKPGDPALGCALLVTGLHTGDVDFTVVVATEDPGPDLAFEDIVESDFEARTADTLRNALPNVDWDVRDQSRMHVHNGHAPYRSVAAWYLWRAVDLHREGKLPTPATPTRIKIVKKKKKMPKKAAPKRKKKSGARKRSNKPRQ